MAEHDMDSAELQAEYEERRAYEEELPTPAGSLRLDDVAHYEAFGGEARQVRVVGLQLDSDIFDGLMPDGTDVWGYARQVTRITPRETIC